MAVREWKSPPSRNASIIDLHAVLKAIAKASEAGVRHSRR